MTYSQAVYAGIGASSLLLVLGVVLVRLRPASARRTEALAQDVWEMAFLAGGPGRVVDAALAGMHEDGRLAVGGPGVVTVRQALARDAVEAAVLDAITGTPGGALATLRATAMRSPAVQGVGDRLAARGLLRHPGPGRGWRRWAGVQMAACGVLFFVGVLVSVAGADGAAVPPFFATLPAVVGGLIVASLCRKAFARRITKAGSFALYTAKAAHAPGGAGGAWQPRGWWWRSAVRRCSRTNCCGSSSRRRTGPRRPAVPLPAPRRPAASRPMAPGAARGATVAPGAAPPTVGGRGAAAAARRAVAVRAVGVARRAGAGRAVAAVPAAGAADSRRAIARMLRFLWRLWCHIA